MKKIVLLLLYLIPFTVVSADDGYRRQKQVDILHYEFSIALNDTNDLVSGRAVIVLRMVSASDTVVLDLNGVNGQGKGMSVTWAGAGGIRTGWTHTGNKLLVSVGGKVHPGDTASMEIRYHGIPADGLIISRNKFGDRTFFADHWPDRAHNYLPCIDHPYDKASVDFIITAPEKYSVVSNGSLLEESSLEGNMKLTHWSEKVPIPVKVMTFGVARFAVAYAGMTDSIPVWSWVFPQNRSEGFSDYAVAVKPLAYYSRLIGPYPYPKLANVQSKTIYGGLENAGAIFYFENSVTGMGRDEALIAHEIAHQWFGNCVTEADWHHIWLSEGFATYLTAMYLESVYGRERLEAEMIRSREMVLNYFSKKPRPVVDTTIADRMQLLNINSYQKGAWILHMLRFETGDENFEKGLRLFYMKYARSNALSADFQNIMESVSGKDLAPFFRQWLYGTGQPEIRISDRYDKKTTSTGILIEQLQPDRFDFTLELLITGSGGSRTEKVRISNRQTRLEIPGKVTDIKPDPGVKLLYRLSGK